MGLIHENQLPEGQGEAQHGMAIFTQEQTAGKGQRSKRWVSEKGANIALSILLNPHPLRIQEQFKLNVCVAISVCELFSNYAGNETKIKWPNDLYWRDRKAGGILIENVVGSSEFGVPGQESAVWKWAVVGIGININQTTFPADLPNPVSLKQITGKNFEPIAMAKEICSVLEKNYQLLMAGKFEHLFRYYQIDLYKKDEKVKLKKNNRLFETTIKGVSETGQLITHHSLEERFEFGEVQWIHESV